MLLACYGYILLLLLVLTAAKIIRAIKNQNHSRNKPQSKNKKTPSSLQQRGPNNFLADKVHHHLQPALFLLLPLLKVPNASPPPPPAPGAYITRPQASTPFQSVLVFACPLSSQALTRLAASSSLPFFLLLCLHWVAMGSTSPSGLELTMAVPGLSSSSGSGKPSRRGDHMLLAGRALCVLQMFVMRVSSRRGKLAWGLRNFYNNVTEYHHCGLWVGVYVLFWQRAGSDATPGTGAGTPP